MLVWATLCSALYIGGGSVVGARALGRAPRSASLALYPLPIICSYRCEKSLCGTVSMPIRTTRTGSMLPVWFPMVWRLHVRQYLLQITYMH